MPCSCGESNCCCSAKCFCPEEFCMCIECFHIKEAPTNQYEPEVITIASSPAASITTVNLDDLPDDKGNIHTGVDEFYIEMLGSPHQELEMDIISIESNKIKQENEALSTILDKTKQENETADAVLDKTKQENETFDAVLDKTKQENETSDVMLEKTKQENERPYNMMDNIKLLPEMSSSESECEILLEKKGLKKTTKREKKAHTKQEDCTNREPGNKNAVLDTSRENNLPSCSNELTNSQNSQHEMSRNRHQFRKRGLRDNTSISSWLQRSYSFSGQYNQYCPDPYNNQERANRSQNISIPFTTSRYFQDCPDPYNNQERANRSQNISIPVTTSRYFQDTQSTSVYDFDENEFLRSSPILNHLCLPTFPEISTPITSTATFRSESHSSFQNHTWLNPDITTAQSVDFGMPESGMNYHHYTVSQSMIQTEFPNSSVITNERNRSVVNCQTSRYRRSGPHQNSQLQNTADTVRQPQCKRRRRRRRRRRRVLHKTENSTVKKEEKSGCSIKKEKGSIKKEIKKEGVSLKREIKQERCFIKKEIKKEKP